MEKAVLVAVGERARVILDEKLLQTRVLFVLIESPHEVAVERENQVVGQVQAFQAPQVKEKVAVEDLERVAGEIEEGEVAQASEGVRLQVADLVEAQVHADEASVVAEDGLGQCGQLVLG